MKGVVSVMLVLLLAGCSETSPPTQKRSALVLRQTTLNMAQLCKDQAAIRYNTQTQLVDVNH